MATQPTPAYGIELSQLSALQKEYIYEQLNMIPEVHTETATADGTTLSFTLGNPILVLIDGQEVDSFDRNAFASETISGLSYEAGSLIKVFYIKNF